MVDGEELRGVRRAMARTMTRAGQAVVPATVTDHAFIDAWPAGENPTHRLVDAMASACKIEPALNAWFDGSRRLLHDHVDLGLAVDTADGLIVPVLHNIESADDLPEQIKTAETLVRKRSASPGDLRGATITLSNFGMLGGVFASLVVSPPQVAILGAGRTSETCISVQGKPEFRRVLPLSLTFDHRAVTGAEAARFLEALCSELGKPTLSKGKNID
jgi:pyruvate dehydrogenase E2 component (dihydrolipoamide acetyltransferase)